MPASTLASTALDSTLGQTSVLETCARLVNDSIPNLLRLYANPFVAQACHCLSQYARTFDPPGASARPRRVFLANSREEGLSGAVKLARFCMNQQGASRFGAILDPSNRLKYFVGADLGPAGKVTFLPELLELRSFREASDFVRRSPTPLGFFVYFMKDMTHSSDRLADFLKSLRDRQPRLIVIACCDRESQTNSNLSSSPPPAEIVVFDESYVSWQVPFGAFAANRQLYRLWERRGMANFHSTTFQPNSISTLHLLNSIERHDPEFFAQNAQVLQKIESDSAYLLDTYKSVYDRALARLIESAGFGHRRVSASGHYIAIDDQRIFDAVAGVACGIRGHNPPSYVQELTQSDDSRNCDREASSRLEDLTGLSHFVLSASGAAAVENAYKIALCSQTPRDYILALRGGFGGKTLFALTGTSKPSLRKGLDPLYSRVGYIDPFSSSALDEIGQAFQKYPIGVVHIELIQGVGGVREIPRHVVDALQEHRRAHDCLLFVDEVQTGMFRTGPFVRSHELQLKPDLLTVGKGTSDMMIPSALTLYSDGISERLAEGSTSLIDDLNSRYRHPYALHSLLNALRRAEQEHLERNVRDKGRLLATALMRELAKCPFVKEIRAHGLLVGIELNFDGFPYRWCKKSLRSSYLLAMLWHETFATLVGFCQYEPHVLKLTPPLSITPEEIEQMASTIGSVCRNSPLAVSWRALKIFLQIRRLS